MSRDAGGCPDRGSAPSAPLASGHAHQRCKFATKVLWLAAGAWHILPVLRHLLLEGQVPRYAPSLHFALAVQVVASHSFYRLVTAARISSEALLFGAIKFPGSFQYMG